MEGFLGLLHVVGVCDGGPDAGGFPPAGRQRRTDSGKCPESVTTLVQIPKTAASLPDCHFLVFSLSYNVRGGPPVCGRTGQNHNELLKPQKGLICLGFNGGCSCFAWFCFLGLASLRTVGLNLVAI